MTNLSPSVLDRFWAKVDKTGVGGCWLWTASRNTPGYGHIKVDGVVLQAHRISYELQNGPIPPGLVIDHLCRVRHCVNPSHMEPVTVAVNNLRGQSPSAKAARKVACPRGHRYPPFQPGGERVCHTCRRDRRRKQALAQSA